MVHTLKQEDVAQDRLATLFKAKKFVLGCL